MRSIGNNDQVGLFRDRPVRASDAEALVFFGQTDDRMVARFDVPFEVLRAYATKPDPTDTDLLVIARDNRELLEKAFLYVADRVKPERLLGSRKAKWVVTLTTDLMLEFLNAHPQPC